MHHIQLVGDRVLLVVEGDARDPGVRGLPDDGVRVVRREVGVLVERQRVVLRDSEAERPIFIPIEFVQYKLGRRYPPGLVGANESLSFGYILDVQN